MKQPDHNGRFLICGLPRSRTAWLAALSETVMGVQCWHEPCARADSWQDALSVWRRGGPPPVFCGISDPTLALHLPAVLDEYRPTTLWVDRPLEAVERSLMRIGIPHTNICSLMLERALPALESPLVRRVAFDDLADCDVVQDCLRYLFDGYTVDLDKIVRFQRLNVQVDPLVMVREAYGEARARAVLGRDVIERLVYG